MTNPNSLTRRLGLRGLVIAMIGSLTFTFGVLAPSPVATAALGKPTSVSAKKITGSNGITVKWKAPKDGKPAAYRVYYGTSSSRSKAKSKYVAGTSVTISSLTTSRTYYVWVQPWSAPASTGSSAGAVSSAVRVTTSKYSYQPPPAIRAVNPTKTSMEVTWRTVTGSPGYVLRAAAKGQKTRYQYGFDGSAVFTGLKPGIGYTFTVANRLPVAGNSDLPGVRMSGYSTAKSTKKTNPVTITLPVKAKTRVPMANAPTKLTATETDHASISLSWSAPSGYDKNKHVFRVDFAENQEMTTRKGSRTLAGTSGVAKGLSSNSNYYVRIQMLQKVVEADGKPVLDKAGKQVMVAVSDRTEAIMAKTRSPKGFIAGTVKGAAGGVLSDYVAVAYSRTTGDVNAQVPVSSGGKYKLEVRPGSYFVQLAYVGSGNYTTQWVAAKGTAYMRAEATAVTAKLGNTPLNVATVTVGQGGVLTGKVVGTNSKALRDVFVSARTAWTSTREVVAQFSTDSGGNFTLRGLPPNKKVQLRINGSQIRRGAANISPTETAPASGKSRAVKTLTLPN